MRGPFSFIDLNHNYPKHKFDQQWVDVITIDVVVDA
jgi:hypothetical protein